MKIETLETIVCVCVGGWVHGVVVNVLKCDIVINEFKLQSRYYSHFWTNALEKDINPPYPPPL